MKGAKVTEDGLLSSYLVMRGPLSAAITLAPDISAPMLRCTTDGLKAWQA